MRTLILALLLLLVFSARAEGLDGRAGHGHVSITYQYIKVDGFTTGSASRNIGETDTQTINFEFDYAISDRWTLSAGIPLITKRYQGDRPHDPQSFNPSQAQELVDDGDYHTEFQDLHVAASYLARATDQMRFEPFVAAGVPSHDYPHFGHAAVGQNLWRFELGARWFYQPYFSRFYYGLSGARVFVEETLDTSVDHWLVNGEMGYYFRPEFSLRAFFILKDGDGLTSSARDFPDRTDPRWFQHDRMLKHNFINAGFGLDWQINNEYRLSASAMTQVDGEWVHIMDYAGTVAVSRSF